jgi:hypothetical protein
MKMRVLPLVGLILGISVTGVFAAQDSPKPKPPECNDPADCLKKASDGLKHPGSTPSPCSNETGGGAGDCGAQLRPKQMQPRPQTTPNMGTRRR